MHIFVCRHDIYELVVEGMFDAKNKHVTSSQIFVQSLIKIGKRLIMIKYKAAAKLWKNAQTLSILKL